MSVFKCAITYKRIEGNSHESTKNKLLAHGFIDKYYNVKTDVATWRKGRSELNELASAKLGRTVNLFEEKKLLNGIRAVPDMKLFGMLDQMNKEGIVDYQPQFVRDEIGVTELGDSDTNIIEPVQTQPIEKRIYSELGIKNGSVISNEKKDAVQQKIDAFNELNTNKKLSLQPVGNGFLINTEFSSTYLYTPTEQIEEFEEDVRTDSNNNFNLPCIK